MSNQRLTAKETARLKELMGLDRATLPIDDDLPPPPTKTARRKSKRAATIGATLFDEPNDGLADVGKNISATE
jgi:hypothetical protein